MEFLGVDIEIVTLVQLLAAVAVVFLYSMLHSLQEGDADHIGERHMILLAQFLIGHHPDFTSVAQIAEASEADINDESTHVYWLASRLNKFQESGKLSSRELAADSNLFEHVVVMLLAPIFAVWSLVITTTEAKRYRSQRILHTEIRKNYVSKNIVFIAPNLLAMVVGIWIIAPTSRFWALVVIVIFAIPILCAIAETVLYVWHQKAWKDFWEDKLLEILAQATKTDDHDLFNRALNLKQYVRTQPDVPLPAGLAFYGVILGGTQAIIVWIFQTFADNGA